MDRIHARPNQKTALTVAVVGATGLVGQELLRTLEQRKFPINKLFPFSSGRSKRKVSVRFRGRKIAAPAVSFQTLNSADLVFLVSSDEVAQRYGPELARRGVWVIDDSSAFRLNPHVPLVIPEVNGSALKNGLRLVAGPNCTLTGAAVAGYPLIRAAGIRAARIASYQAVSGAGKSALEEFLDQGRRVSSFPLKSVHGKLKKLRPRSLPRAIAMNVIPQVGAFDAAGQSSEEWKVSRELKKIWGKPHLPVSTTAVRVPVLRGHSLAFWLETKRPLSVKRAYSILRRADGIRLWPKGTYPTPHEAHGTWPVHVGRIRRGVNDRELCLWIVSDNLLKGAALNSVQIAEELLRRGLLKPHSR